MHELGGFVEGFCARSGGRLKLDGQLVAATGSWLWRSADGATSWEPLLDEPRIGPITALAVSDSVLTIASATSGLWEAHRCFE